MLSLLTTNKGEKKITSLVPFRPFRPSGFFSKDDNLQQMLKWSEEVASVCMLMCMSVTKSVLETCLGRGACRSEGHG